jgi:hypothetical protein
MMRKYNVTNNSQIKPIIYSDFSFGMRYHIDSVLLSLFHFLMCPLLWIETHIRFQIHIM